MASKKKSVKKSPGKTAKKSKRSCSSCGKVGHNVRTCPSRPVR